MRYPHRVRIFRYVGEEGGGTQDPDTGVPVPPVDPDAETEEVYAGPADVQDEGVVIDRDLGGQPVRTADAIVFLADESIIPLVKVGDIVEVEWLDQYDSVSDGSVQKVVRLDGTLMVRYL